MKTVFTLAIAVWAIAYGETNIRVAAIDDSLPNGPFYCQARCLASCIDTNLAPTLEECTKFCPPFDSAMPCPPSNLDCWRNCGIPPTPRDKPPPPAVNFVMAQHVSSADPRVQDPFTIELTWDPVPTASVYIVELYPINREPRPGENNFFRALTSFPTYTVRKEDECTIYDIRVLPVNAFGIGAPQYTRIEAPRPVMTGPENFFVRSIRRDPINENFVIVNVEYALLAAWPVLDVDLAGIRVKAVECRGMGMQNNGTASFGIQAENAWYPFYDILIEKMPTPHIQMAFLHEVVKSDCLFQMRVSALTSRCNTTTYFDSNGGATQDSTIGVDFRINCLTAEGFSCTDNARQPPPPPPEPNSFIPPAASMPIPPPVPSFITTINETFSAPIMPPGAATPVRMPQQSPSDSFSPPFLPPGVAEKIQIAPLPPGPPSPMISPHGPAISVGTINQNTHPLLIDYLEINAQPIPAICDIDTLDVQPFPSILGPSMIDLAVSWAERNPGGQRAPSYFIVRYGPIMRTLVEDSRRPQRIITGQENIVRTGTPPPVTQFIQGPPERQIKVLGVPKGTLLSFQVCAIYDTNVEHLISWEMVQSQHVDLLALQPAPGPNASDVIPKGPITSQAPLATDESPLSAAPAGNGLLQENLEAGIPPSNTGENTLAGDSMGDHVDESGPIILQVGIVDTRPSITTFWLMLIGGVFLTVLTGVMLFMFVVRLCAKRDDEKVKGDPFPQIPIAMITKAYQPQSQKEEEEKQVEKIALP